MIGSFVPIPAHALSLLERLQRSVPNVFEVKLIVGIRNQPEMLASYYSEYVRSGGTMSFRRLIGSPYSHGRKLMPYLRYARYIERAHRLLDRENALIYLFEDLKRDNERLIERIEQFAGIEQGTPFSPGEGERNPRLTPWASG